MSQVPYRLTIASSDWPGLADHISQGVIPADFSRCRQQRRSISSNKAYNPAVAIFIWHLNETALERIATDPKTPADILRQLAEYPHPDIRALLAENETTPMEVRWTLIKDENPNVRFQLAESPHLPSEMLEMLANDDNPYVACRAQETLDRLSANN